MAVAYLTNNFTDATKYIIIGFVIIYAIALIFLIYFFKPKNYSSSLKRLEELQIKMEIEKISEVLSNFLEKLILRKKFKINFRSELCQKNQKTKMN